MAGEWEQKPGKNFLKKVGRLLFAEKGLKSKEGGASF
jgi:hypothetical protein